MFFLGSLTALLFAAVSLFMCASIKCLLCRIANTSRQKRRIVYKQYHEQASFHHCADHVYDLCCSLAHWSRFLGTGGQSLCINHWPWRSRLVRHTIHNGKYQITCSWIELKCAKVLCSDAVVLWRACAVWMNQRRIVCISALLFVTSIGTHVLYRCV
jgi:hypothetical protein